MSFDSHCDAFELGKSRGIQNREHLLRKKASDALKREAKALKKAKKVAAKEKSLRKDAKKTTTLEDFMPPQSADFDLTKYLNAPQITVEEPVKEDCGEKSEEISDAEDDDCVLVDHLERGFDMDSPEEGWALL